MIIDEQEIKVILIRTVRIFSVGIAADEVRGLGRVIKDLLRSEFETVPFWGEMNNRILPVNDFECMRIELGISGVDEERVILVADTGCSKSVDRVERKLRDCIQQIHCT